MKTLSRKQWYLGVNGAMRKGFQSRKRPTTATNPEFKAVIGPFKTKAAMRLVMDAQSTFPTVQDAENYVKRKKERRKPKSANCIRIKDIKECGWCGKEFHNSSPYQNCCSQDCYFHHNGAIS